MLSRTLPADFRWYTIGNTLVCYDLYDSFQYGNSGAYRASVHAEVLGDNRIHYRYDVHNRGGSVCSGVADSLIDAQESALIVLNDKMGRTR